MPAPLAFALLLAAAPPNGPAVEAFEAELAAAPFAADALPAVLAAAESDDPDLRRAGVGGLTALALAAWGGDQANVEPDAAVVARLARDALRDATAGWDERPPSAERAEDLLWVFFAGSPDTRTPEGVAESWALIDDRLTALLDHPDAGVRARARRALARRGAAGDAVVPLLLKALNDLADLPPTLWALRAEDFGDLLEQLDRYPDHAGEIGAAAVPALLRAFTALADLPDVLWHPNADELRDLIEGLNRFPDRSAEVRAVVAPRAGGLIRAAYRPPGVRLARPFSRVFDIFYPVEWGPDAFGFAEAAGRLTDEPDPDPREDEIGLPVAATGLLSWIGPAAAGELPRIEPLLETGSLPDRLRAAQAVAEIDPSRPGLPALIRAATADPRPDWKDLGYDPPEGDPAAKADWQARSETEDAWYRAVNVVGRMGPHAAFARPRLRPLLDRAPGSLERYARDDLFAAFAATGPLPDDALAPFARHAARGGASARQPLADAGPRAVPHLLGALSSALEANAAENATDEAEKAARTLLTLLAEFGPLPDREARAATAALRPALTAPDAGLRKTALAAVIAIRPPLELLATALSDAAADPDPGVRLAAVRTLAGRPNVNVPALPKAVGDPDPRVRLAAVRGVHDRVTRGRVSAADRSALAAALPDGSAGVRLAAVLAWRAAGFGEAALAPLRDDPNPAVRVAARGE